MHATDHDETACLDSAGALHLPAVCAFPHSPSMDHKSKQSTTVIYQKGALNRGDALPLLLPHFTSEETVLQKMESIQGVIHKCSTAIVSPTKTMILGKENRAGDTRDNSFVLILWHS